MKCNIKSIIIPSCLVKVYSFLLKEEGISEEDLEYRVESSLLWSKKLSWEHTGMRRLPGYRLLFRSCPKIYKNWEFFKSERGICWAWNKKSNKVIYLNYFDLHILIQEYFIHVFNFLSNDCSDKNNFLKRASLDYSEFFELKSNFFTKDDFIPHGLIVGELKVSK